MTETTLAGRSIRIVPGPAGPGPALFWPAAADERGQGKEVAALLPQDRPWTLVMLLSEDWNRDYSPWPAPAVYGKDDFTGGGPALLQWLREKCVPFVDEALSPTARMIGGYSLAGLFSLWAFYASDGLFQGAVSCSGSLWFPGWEDYSAEYAPPAGGAVYLSLGDREELTRHTVLSRVGNATRAQHAWLAADPQLSRTALVMHPGGHFRDPVRRIAAGFSWILEE